MTQLTVAPQAGRSIAAGAKTCTRCAERPSTRRGLCHRCYMAVMTRQKAYGRWESGHVDAQPVREHVSQLLAAGLGARRIAELAGVNRKAVQHLMNGRSDRGTGPSKMLMRPTAEKLLAVPVPAVPWQTAAPKTLVDGTGARRRLQALIADGHTVTEMAAAIGWTVTNLSAMLNRDGDVTAATARLIADMFTHLQMTPGSNERARRRGARLGWPLPMEWGEDTIDDPAAVPQRPARAARAEVADRRQEVAAWLDDSRTEAAKGTVRQLADRLGVSVAVIERDKAIVRSERANQEAAA